MVEERAGAQTTGENGPPSGAGLEAVAACLRATRSLLPAKTSNCAEAAALHPHDPDAMGLHITLLAVEVLEPAVVEKEYGLARNALNPWRKAAWSEGRMLAFCVGTTEEVFTQCSQNLFIKQPVRGSARRAPATHPNAWNPALPLERLLASQFETFQVTVSAHGVPGASPRNGDRGKAVFLGRRGRKTYLLIPYHSGNAVHGHAAKLWSNSHGTIVIYDDHSALSAVTVSGPSRVVSHEWVARDFPLIAGEAASGKNAIKCQFPILNIGIYSKSRKSDSSEKLSPPILSILEGGHAASTPGARRATIRSPPISWPVRFRPMIKNCSMNGRRRGVRRILWVASIAAGTRACDLLWSPAGPIFSTCRAAQMFRIWQTRATPASLARNTAAALT